MGSKRDKLGGKRAGGVRRGKEQGAKGALGMKQERRGSREPYMEAGGMRGSREQD